MTNINAIRFENFVDLIFVQMTYNCGVVARGHLHRTAACNSKHSDDGLATVPDKDTISLLGSLKMFRLSNPTSSVKQLHENTSRATKSQKYKCAGREPAQPARRKRLFMRFSNLCFYMIWSGCYGPLTASRDMEKPSRATVQTCPGSSIHLNL